jgi:hypothetical protein
VTALDKYVLTSLKPCRSPHRQCSGSLTVSPVASGQPPFTYKPIIDEGDDRRHAGNCGWADVAPGAKCPLAVLSALAEDVRMKCRPFKPNPSREGFDLRMGESTRESANSRNVGRIKE